MTDFVSRAEFMRLASRVDSIDAGGTRGVAVLAVQIQELTKDMAKHEDQHDRDEAQRASGRRWLFMAVVALVAAIDGPIVTVVLAHGGH